jgi:hypothetical protein
VAHGDGPAALQPTDGPLHCVAFLVSVWIDRQTESPDTGAGTLRDGVRDPAAAQVGVHGLIAVSLVPGQPVRPAAGAALRPWNADAVHQRGEDWHLMALPGAQQRGQGNAVAVGHQVDFGREAAAAQAERVIGRFKRAPLLPAPAAERLARTWVLSTHHSSGSMRPSASNST